MAKPAGPESYGYDNLDRLDTFTLPGNSAVDYSYDLVGNRLSVSQSGVTSNLTYASSANRLINNAGVAITYDANGNPLTDGGESYTYNARNRLVQVSNGSGVIASYAYNALGQRVNKVAGSADIDFVYDLNGLLLGEYANGLLIREYVHGPNGPIAQIESDGSVLTLHTDHLGTPRAATDANQTVVWRWEGRPFGETAAVEGPDGDMTDVTVNLRFPGQYFDMETGQHYNYFRTYDPSVGRYTQSDPIGLNGGLNTYTYVHGNPINIVDFYGLDASLYSKDPRTADPSDYTGPSLPTLEPPPSWSKIYGPFGHVCGPENSARATWIPDGRFRDACASHDVCYSCSGESRQSCDDNFCESLLESCPPWDSLACEKAAKFYCNTVRSSGAEYYQPAGGAECSQCE